MQAVRYHKLPRLYFWLKQNIITQKPVKKELVVLKNRSDQNGQKKEKMIAVYSRKSKFTGKGESIGNQVELCREYIQNHYGESALEQILVFEDEGFSGGNLNRPGFKQMMEAARKRNLKAIIVYRLDRISRNISDFAGLIEELSRLEIAFISMKEQFDTGTPMGRAMMYIASVFAQLERETIAERIRDNMHELAKTGRWLGGVTPTGYASEAVKRMTIDGKTKKVCKLKLIPEEAEVVCRIYELYRTWDSQTMTEAELMREGIRTKNGNDFTRFSIRAILQNPVYMIADQDAYDYFVSVEADLFSSKEAFDGIHGILAYNRTKQEKGKTTEFLPPTEWIVCVGQHRGIIPGIVWVSVQKSLERNKEKSFRKPRTNQALLTGLLYCSCGSRMYPKMSRNKTHTYVCKRKERSRKEHCDQKNIAGDVLDQAIMEQIKLLKEDRKTFLHQLEQNRGFYMGNRSDCERKLTEQKNEKSDTEKRIAGLVDSLAELKNQAAKEYTIRRIEQLNQQCKYLESCIQISEETAQQHRLDAGQLETIGQQLIFQNGIGEMTLEQKRGAVRTLIQKVVWDGEQVYVELFGAQTHWCEDSK